MAGPRKGIPHWRAEEVSTLRAMWPNHTAREIGDLIGRPRGAVKGKAAGLRLQRKTPTPGEEVIAILRESGLFGIKRFADNIRISDDDCWNWEGASNGWGYGLVSVGGKNHKLHRLSYEISRGQIPPGMFVCHHCDKPWCINPDHLFLGTPQDNMDDKIRKGRARYAAPRGQDNGKSRFTNSQILTIRDDPRSGPPIAKEYGVNVTTIQRIKSRKLWGHLP